MTPSPVHSLRRHSTFNGLLLAATLMLVCSSVAEASPAPAVVTASRPVQTGRLVTGAGSPAATPAVPSAEQEVLCSRVRKRFWVEGEGWIVRRVSACR